MPGDAAELLERLPTRYRGLELDPLPGRFRLKIDRTIRDVVIDAEGCRVERSNGKLPDSEIHTDIDTWREIDDGRLSGIEAFAARRLVVRGSIGHAMRFEPLFVRPRRGGMRYEIGPIETPRARISTLLAGKDTDPPVVLVHGLGATKASWLTIVPQLARRHRVIAIDLPGFGDSTKPLGRYDARWFSDHLFDLLDVLGHEQVHVAGNSMGGRVAMEMAMQHPERVSGIACLCPAAAFSHRPVVNLVKVLRPEFGMLPSRLPRARLLAGLADLFADPACVHPTWYEAAIDDFLKTWRSPRARIAFFAAARNIYLDEPDGDVGFWARLSKMEPPALYIYGRRDVLITSHFGKKVSKHLPGAEVHVWPDCGHVPQIEHPGRTAEEIMRFFGTASRRSTGRRIAG
jgi:pimeloyl-ACP methyl ester carboxylesterase